MIAAVRSSWALFLGIALMMLGNGLQGSLLGIRASLEGFPTTLTGILMSGYFAGFLIGSVLAPRLVARVGHVRVFAALASLASTAIPIHAVWVHPASWTVIRLVTGFCYARLYVVVESWLNDQATNQTRGQLLSLYMIVMLGGAAGGQYLLNLADPGGVDLFILVSVLVSLSLIPLLLLGRATCLRGPGEGRKAGFGCGVGRVLRPRLSRHQRAAMREPGAGRPGARFLARLFGIERAADRADARRHRDVAALRRARHATVRLRRCAPEEPRNPAGLGFVRISVPLGFVRISRSRVDSWVRSDFRAARAPSASAQPSADGAPGSPMRSGNSTLFPPMWPPRSAPASMPDAVRRDRRVARRHRLAVAA